MEQEARPLGVHCVAHVTSVPLWVCILHLYVRLIPPLGLLRPLWGVSRALHTHSVVSALCQAPARDPLVLPDTKAAMTTSLQRLMRAK